MKNNFLESLNNNRSAYVICAYNNNGEKYYFWKISRTDKGKLVILTTQSIFGAKFYFTEFHIKHDLQEIFTLHNEDIKNGDTVIEKFAIEKISIIEGVEIDSSYYNQNRPVMIYPTYKKNLTYDTIIHKLNEDKKDNISIKESLCNIYQNFSDILGGYFIS